MECVKVFGHSILLSLVFDIVLMLGQAVNSVETTLAVVLGQDVCGRADLAGDSGPGVRGAPQVMLAACCNSACCVEGYGTH